MVCDKFAFYFIKGETSTLDIFGRMLYLAESV